MHSTARPLSEPVSISVGIISFDKGSDQDARAACSKRSNTSLYSFFQRKIGDALALDSISHDAGAIYVMDRDYVDFRRLYVLHQAGAFFVTRTKINRNYHRVYSRLVDKVTGARSDQTIALDGFYGQSYYPQHLRRVGIIDPETSKRLVLLTNNLPCPR
jgi:hypothetical protein